ncbi:MAG: hypothetical protein JST12_01815 [Armatimonadetes bacterium]|nr:hypothetical protein [Armatimonadota bacterium]
MKLRPLLLLAALALAGYGGYRWVGSQRIAIAAQKTQALEQAFQQGTANPLPGPYLEAGNPYELQFEVTQLLGKPGALIPDGKLLTQDGKTWRLFDRDGVLLETRVADATYLSIDGKLYSFTEDASKSGTVTYSDGDGQSRKVELRPEASGLVENQDFAIHGFGYSSRVSQPVGRLEYVGFDLEPHSIPINSGRSIFFSTWNADLGDIGYATDSPRKLVFFRNGQLTYEDLPADSLFGNIVGVGSVVGFNAELSRRIRVPYVRQGPNQFAPLLVPPDTISASVSALNANGSYFLRTWHREEPISPPKKPPYVLGFYYVSNGKYYDVHQLIEVLFGDQPVDTGKIDETLLDEQGDIVATTDRGTFLLKPIPHVDP